MRQANAFKSIAVLAAAILVGVAAARADDAGSAVDGAPHRDDRVAAQLDRIAAAVEALERHQGVEVLIGRLRLKQDRLLVLERRVQAAAAEVESLEDQLEQFRMLEREWAEETGEGLGGAEDDELRRQRRLLEERLKSVEDQIRDRRLRHAELEADLDRAEDGVRDLERTIDERLGLR